MTNSRVLFAMLGAVAIALIVSGCEGGGGNSYADSGDIGDNTPNTYLCIGDSITHGYGLPSSESYPNQLAGLLGGQYVINAGRDGERSWEGADRLDSLLQRYNPQWVLILYGANDVIYGSSSQTIPNLERMVNMCRANKSIPIVATLSPAFGPHAYMADELRVLNPRIRDWAQNTANVRLADLDSAFNWEQNGYYQSDGLHHTSAGAHLDAMTFFGQIDQGFGYSSSLATGDTTDAAAEPTTEFLVK